MRNLQRKRQRGSSKFDTIMIVQTRRFRPGCSLPKRYLAISIRDARLASELSTSVVSCLESIIDIEDQSYREIDLEDLMNVCAVMRDSIIYEEQHEPKRILSRVPRTVESFNESDVGSLFRFRSHADLRRLLAVWRLPVCANGKVAVTNNRHYMFPEEILLFSLRRLASKHTLDEHTLILSRITAQTSLLSENNKISSGNI